MNNLYKLLSLIICVFAVFASYASKPDVRILDNIYVEQNFERNGVRGVNIVAGIDLSECRGHQVRIMGRIETGQKEYPAMEDVFMTVDRSYAQHVEFFVPESTLPEGYCTAHIYVKDLTTGDDMRIVTVSTFEHKKGDSGLIWSIPRTVTAPGADVTVRNSQASVPMTMKMYGRTLAQSQSGTVSVSRRIIENAFKMFQSHGHFPVEVNGEKRVMFRERPVMVSDIALSRNTRDGQEMLDVDLGLSTYNLGGKTVGLWASLCNGSDIIPLDNGEKYLPFVNLGNVADNSFSRQRISMPWENIPVSVRDQKITIVVYPYIVENSSWQQIDSKRSDSFVPSQIKGSYNPGPAPSKVKQLPVINWLTCPATSQSKQMSIKVGVKSSKQITDWHVYVNGSLLRGLRPVRNDGYDLMIQETVTLQQGTNSIRVDVTNGDGTASETRNVEYTDNSNVVIHEEKALKKLALVVGNAAYPGQELNNTVNDATAIAATLRTLGFDVISVSNSSRRDLDNAINDFGSRAGNYDVALFYYAGHGIQYKGNNYLIPVNANLQSEADVEYECTDVNRVLDKLDESGCKMKVIILDACRNNPFERSWHRGAGGGRGLSVISAPVGTLISYATSPGTTAADGVGQHSPYTQALLEVLKEKDVPIESVFKNVGVRVVKSTNKTQTPWYSSSLYEGEFIINPSR